MISCMHVRKGGPGASGRVLPPVTGRSWVRVVVSSHYTGEGKACHRHPSPDPAQSRSTLHWVRPFLVRFKKKYSLTLDHLLKKKGVPSAESSRSVRGLGKGVSGKPYSRLCNARRPRLEPRTFQSQAVRLYRLHHFQCALRAIRKN